MKTAAIYQLGLQSMEFIIRFAKYNYTVDQMGDGFIPTVRPTTIAVHSNQYANSNISKLGLFFLIKFFARSL